ncbi:MAG: TonB-dependent receptor [Adhaeribacter sp.]
MKKLLLAWLLAVCPLLGFSQSNLSGLVTDAATGAPLPGASIRLDQTRWGATTDLQGGFQLRNLPAGTYELVATYVGYKTYRQSLALPQGAQALTIALERSSLQADEVVVSALRASEQSPTTFTNVSREQIRERNFGQDLPYLLEQTPSVVVNSDAGAGVGYTGIRIRGSDITRINVTVNGIPINDPESHSTFFVNMPDLASSVQDVQVQRGVGTSTNGGAAFGASLNIRTTGFNQEAYAEANNTYGSFNTWKHTLAFGTGLIRDKFSFDGRLSKVASDGYIDRAFSKLKSYYFSGGYQGKTGMLKFITFSGQEQTYQAWNGVPADKLATDRTYNSLTYENETDNYQQDHYQLHFSKTLGSVFDLGGALHLTRGKGYYEQYKENQKLANYLIAPLVLPDTTLARTDLIRQKWLDNYFYGATYALNYRPAGNRLTATLGGGWNRYEGEHYGEVIWARYAAASEKGHRYYQGDARKTDFNIFTKANYQLTPALDLFGDLQYRQINYEIAGTDDDLVDVGLQADFRFFNPKAGLTYALNERQHLYASYAVGNREPVRSDFVDRKGSAEPQAETMYNLELGYRLRRQAGDVLGRNVRLELDLNGYYMDYYNQLVLTGQLNDVGAPLRTNIRDSYRGGIELAGLVHLQDFAQLSSTLALSRNKIRNYRETVYEYDSDYNVTGVLENEYRETDISFSPNVVSSHQLELLPLPGLRAALLYKTVGRQFLDNTSSRDRQIAGYGVMDLRLRYLLRPGFLREAEIALLLNNVLNKKYVNNGYTFSEQYAGDPGRYDYNYYYPQATRNFLVSLNLRF